MPDIFLGEPRYIKNQVRVASDEFGEIWGIARPSSGVPTTASLEEGPSPRARRKSPRGDLRGLDQLPASRLFIQDFDLLIGQLADETIYHQPCLAEASCEGRMHPVKPFIMACR